MKASRLATVALAAGGLVFAATWVIPGMGLAARLVVEGAAPDGGWAISARQLGLLGRSALLALSATMLCHILALIPARVFSRDAVARRPAIIAASLCLLLCPPMVYAFGWQRLERFAGVSAGDMVRCVAVWAMWLWPAPAALLAAGWRSGASDAADAACLDASRGAALLHVGLPALARHLIVSVVITMVLLLGEYSVPHACALNVFGTELLGWTSNSRFAIDTVWRAAFVTAPALGLTALAFRFAPGRNDEAPTGAVPDRASPRSAIALTAALLVVSWLIPLAALFVDIRVPVGPAEVLRTYGEGLLQTLALAALAGVLSVAMGVMLGAGGRSRRLWLGLAIAIGAMPAALVGEMMLKAYQWRATALIADHAPIVVLCHLARYGWIGLLAGWLAMRTVPRELLDAARVDGAGEGRLVTALHLRLGAPVLTCGAAVVAALAAGELAATTVVQPPTVRLIAQVIIEKFHRFEDGMLAWLCLALCTTGALAALAAALLARSVATGVARRRG